jgi:hypothetical protein
MRERQQEIQGKRETIPPTFYPQSGREERRLGLREQVWKGIDFSAEVRCRFDTVWMVKVMNLGSHGALLEFPPGKVPPLREDEKISVKLRLREDVVWLPGIVRHRYGLRAGIFFPKVIGRGKKPGHDAVSRLVKAVQQGPVHSS